MLGFDDYFAHFGCSTPNLKGRRQFPPPTWNPWNGCSGHCCQANKPLLTCHQSAPKLDRLISSSALTVGSTDSIDSRRCLPLQPYPIRFEPRSNKDQHINKYKWMMKLGIAPVPWMKRNKFPVAVPWILPFVNSWHFHRLLAPNRTESEWQFC